MSGPSANAPVEVEVVYAEPRRQRLLALRVPPGSSAEDAVLQSGICNEFPQIDLANCTLGVWGLPVKKTQIVKAGDRVEIYRALQMDPREARRQLATHGKAMGGGSV